MTRNHQLSALRHPFRRMRFCRRCGEIKEVVGKRSKFCEDCKLNKGGDNGKKSVSV